MTATAHIKHIAPRAGTALIAALFILVAESAAYNPTNPPIPTQRKNRGAGIPFPN
jgi:hypothetical protein